ncbi:MAG TPA: DUF4294 domain-containing protein [Tangfeifania sp.]|nr:DUF4294 domain-containing protein [Tangfeifania sp.]
MNRILKKYGLLTLIVLLALPEVWSQEKDTTDFMIGIVEGEDTLIHKNIQEVWVMPPRRFESRRHERRYNRYVNKVKKVLPYAKEAGRLLEKYEPVYFALEEQSDRRQLMKKLEDELMSRYKDELKKMTISEGRILLKLIDRETSRTSFKLLKDFRGGFSAFFWQGIARLFGSDLKAEYDPEGEDRMLEEIVTLVEVGYF